MSKEQLLPLGRRTLYRDSRKPRGPGVKGVSPAKVALLQGSQPCKRPPSPKGDDEWMLAPRGIAAAVLLAFPMWAIVIVLGRWLLR